MDSLDQIDAEDELDAPRCEVCGGRQLLSTRWGPRLVIGLGEDGHRWLLCCPCAKDPQRVRTFISLRTPGRP